MRESVSPLCESETFDPRHKMPSDRHLNSWVLIYLCWFDFSMSFLTTTFLTFLTLLEKIRESLHIILIWRCGLKKLIKTTQT